MANKGVTMRAIGIALGYSPTSSIMATRKLIEAGLRESISMQAEQMRIQARVRLEALLSSVWDKAVGGDLGYVDRARQLVMDIANLEGVSKKDEGAGSGQINQIAIVLPDNGRTIPIAAKAETISFQPR